MFGVFPWFPQLSFCLLAALPLLHVYGFISRNQCVSIFHCPKAKKWILIMISGSSLSGLFFFLKGGGSVYLNCLGNIFMRYCWSYVYVRAAWSWNYGWFTGHIITVDVLGMGYENILCQHCKRMNGMIRVLSSLDWWGIVLGYAGCISTATCEIGTSVCLCDVYTYKFTHNMSNAPK